ncbi:MAG: HD domain-containing protein [Desulfovibrio sp.]
MAAIRKSLLEFLFSGAFMKRWNDKLRPMELVEVDKQGHKMMVAWMLYILNSKDMDDDERIRLGETIVEGGLFDYLYRLVITDIKPPVFYRIRSNPDDYRRLTDWVIEELRPYLAPLGDEFLERAHKWYMDTDSTSLSRRILEASHLYASYSEFKLLLPINRKDDELDEIEDSFVDRLRDLEDVKGVRELVKSREDSLAKFARRCGHLRFQKRWSQTPRVPETSVLGHMFIVAAFGWFFSFELDACPARKVNNFFAGLIHDLPELLTRDIISPVKKSAPEIAELIRIYEEEELRESILGPLDEGGYNNITERLSYMLGLDTGSEFHNTIREDGVAKSISCEELSTAYNSNASDPKDGDLLKAADNLAAFIEAYTALKNGISSAELHLGCFRIRTAYREKPLVCGVNIGTLLADFD